MRPTRPRHALIARTRIHGRRSSAAERIGIRSTGRCRTTSTWRSPGIGQSWTASGSAGGRVVQLVARGFVRGPRELARVEPLLHNLRASLSACRGPGNAVRLTWASLDVVERSRETPEPLNGVECSLVRGLRARGRARRETFVSFPFNSRSAPGHLRARYTSTSHTNRFFRRCVLIM